MALKIGYALVPLLAGLDKFFNLLTFWPHYVSPTAAALLPVGPQEFMYVVGVIEVAVGAAILARWTTLGSSGCCASRPTSFWRVSSMSPCVTW